MLKANRRHIIISGTVLVLFLSLAVGAYASVIVSTKTTTVTTTFPWTVSLSDIHSTTVLNVPATATITYQSTSSTASSTTTTTTSTSSSTTSTSTRSSTTSIASAGSGADTEMVGHVFDSSGACRPIFIPDVIVHFTSTPTVTNSVGSNDAWQIQFYMADSVHNELAVLSFTTLNGVHQSSQVFYNTLTGTIISSQTVDVNAANGGVAGPGQPLNSDLQSGQFVDFYSDGDAGQVFWYGINTANIQFSYNFQLFGASNFAPNDLAVQFAPLTAGSTLTFSNLAAFIQMGNQFQSPQSPSAINVQSILMPPATHEPCAPGIIPLVQNTNACEQLAGIESSGIIADERMTSD